MKSTNINTNGRVSHSDEAAIACFELTHGKEPQFTKLYHCIASAAGIYEATIIQIVQGWCLSNAADNKRGYFYAEEWWTGLAYSEWIKRYPFLGTEGSIRKRIVAMEKAGYLFSCQPRKGTGDRGKFYRVNKVKVGNIIKTSVGNNIPDAFNTDTSVGNNIPPHAEYYSTPMRNNIPHDPPAKSVLDSVSGSLLDIDILDQQLNTDLERSVVDFEKQEEPDWEKIGKETELEQAEYLATNVEIKPKIPRVVNKSSDLDQSAAPIENDSHCWECPEPKLRREFMGWLTDTARGIQTARHAANWCNKNPQDADLAWDDFLKARKRSEAQITSFASWDEERHQMMLRTYHSAVERSQGGTHVFLDNFKAQNSAWLDWAKQNRPEWFKSSRSA